MELIEGDPLEPLITPGGLSLVHVLEIALPLAEALRAAHAQGIIHRDLKPSNVMRLYDGRIKVLDFGLAKLSASAPPGTADLTARTQSAASIVGQVVGTVPYMAPEQIRGETVDARSDLFAFGVLIYELATGRRPFTGATPVDICTAILRDTPAKVTSVREDFPDAFDRIVERCLAKEVQSRFQDASSVIEELRGLQTGPHRSGPEHSRLRTAPRRPTRMRSVPSRSCRSRTCRATRPRSISPME
jgi:serine/threonine protein kinase